MAYSAPCRLAFSATKIIPILVFALYANAASAFFGGDSEGPSDPGGETSAEGPSDSGGPTGPSGGEPAGNEPSHDEPGGVIALSEGGTASQNIVSSDKVCIDNQSALEVVCLDDGATTREFR
jgi:hypothetical protein